MYDPDLRILNDAPPRRHLFRAHTYTILPLQVLFRLPVLLARRLVPCYLPAPPSASSLRVYLEPMNIHLVYRGSSRVCLRLRLLRPSIHLHSSGCPWSLLAFPSSDIKRLLHFNRRTGIGQCHLANPKLSKTLLYCPGYIIPSLFLDEMVLGLP